MLIKGSISKIIIARMNSIKSVEQTDIDAAIADEAQHVEEYIFKAIKALTITIPPGGIIVSGPTGAMSNIQPIILNNVIK